MTAAPLHHDPAVGPVPRGRIISWGVWDWGSAAFNAVILTFVYSVYLTDAVGDDLPGSISANTWFSWSLGLAGFFIAVLAPVTGQRADAGGRRKRSLGIWTGLTVISMAGLFWVQNDYHYLWLGLVLLGLGSIFFEFASVSYNAMLHQVSTPTNIGRVSAFGWSMGYFGGIVLLLICYVGFIATRRRMVRSHLRRWPQHPDGRVVRRGLVRHLRHPGAAEGAGESRDCRPPSGSVSSRPTACCSATCGSCTGRIRTPCTSWAPVRCSVTGWQRCSRSARSWPSPSTGSTRPTC